jgi:hypothetical protein
MALRTMFDTRASGTGTTHDEGARYVPISDHTRMGRVMQSIEVHVMGRHDGLCRVSVIEVQRHQCAASPRSKPSC